MLLSTNYVRFRSHIDRIAKTKTRNVVKQNPDQIQNSTDVELVAAEMTEREVSDGGNEQEEQTAIANRTSSSKKQLWNFRRIPAFYKSPRTKFTINSVSTSHIRNQYLFHTNYYLLSIYIILLLCYHL